MKDLSVLIFFYMVQALLMILSGTYFFNIKLLKRQIAFITVFFGFMIWAIRYLYEYFQIPFGTHTLVLAIVFCFIVKIFSKVSFNNAVGISLISFSLVLLGSGIANVVNSFVSLNGEQVLNNPLLHIIFGFMENSILIIYLIINKIFKFNIKIIDEEDGV